MVSGACGTLEENTLADKLGIYMENTLMVVIILGYGLSNSIFWKIISPCHYFNSICQRALYSSVKDTAEGTRVDFDDCLEESPI